MQPRPPESPPLLADAPLRNIPAVVLAGGRGTVCCRRDYSDLRESPFRAMKVRRFRARRARWHPRCREASPRPCSPRACHGTTRRSDRERRPRDVRRPALRVPRHRSPGRKPWFLAGPTTARLRPRRASIPALLKFHRSLRAAADDPSCRSRRRSSVGRNAIVRSGAKIRLSAVLPCAVVPADARITDAIVTRDAVLGGSIASGGVGLENCRATAIL
jgi:hypothetical protein